MHPTLPVSVVIPAYNRADMLARALCSVSAQRACSPAEVIVVDDGSSDDSAGIAERFGAKVIRHAANRGLSAARNTGLQAATQPWVALLDSDDEWLEHHLAHLWRLRGDHVLVASSSLRCGTDPNGDQFHGAVARVPVVLGSAEQLIFPGNIIPVSASMVRRDAALAAGGFRSRRGVVEDLDLWLRVLEHGSGVCSPRVGIIYHLHDEQMSTQDRRTMQLAHLEAGEAHRQRSGGSRAPLRRWEGVAAWENLRTSMSAGHRTTAIRWGVYIASHPARLQGLVHILAFHYMSRQRAAEVRAAGVGPDRRGLARATSS